jgi:hypothetical protein
MFQSPFKTNRSAQSARRIKRNRKENLPRLDELKFCVGCMVCGKQIPPCHLDGHHVDPRFKDKPLAWKINKPWIRVVEEIFGINRDQPGGGGPIQFACQRFHEERHHRGNEALTCVELEKQGHKKPWIIRKRKISKRYESSKYD